MKWLRWGLLEEMSPLGLLATGLAVGAVATPAVRKGLRGAAVALVKGALTVTEEAREASRKAREEWTKLMEEVKQEREECENRELLHGAGLGVARAVTDIKEGVSGLIAEARGITGECRGEDADKDNPDDE